MWVLEVERLAVEEQERFDGFVLGEAKFVVELGRGAVTYLRPLPELTPAHAHAPTR